jgi:hypothetical protein
VRTLLSVDNNDPEDAVVRPTALPIKAADPHLQALHLPRVMLRSVCPPLGLVRLPLGLRACAAAQPGAQYAMHGRGAHPPLCELEPPAEIRRAQVLLPGLGAVIAQEKRGCLVEERLGLRRGRDVERDREDVWVQALQAALDDRRLAAL